MCNTSPEKWQWQHMYEVRVVQLQIKEFCVCVCLVFVSACLFVVQLKSVCPYQCSGLEEITEQKTMGGLVWLGFNWWNNEPLQHRV